MNSALLALVAAICVLVVFCAFISWPFEVGIMLAIGGLYIVCYAIVEVVRA